jgi:hypothetical protein
MTCSTTRTFLDVGGANSVAEAIFVSSLPLGERPLTCQQRTASMIAERREVPGNLWLKCPETGQLVFHKDVEANQFVIPGSNYHMRMSATARLKSLFDNGEFERRCGSDSYREGGNPLS